MDYLKRFGPIYEAIKQENVTAVKSQIPDKDTLEAISRTASVETKGE